MVILILSSFSNSAHHVPHMSPFLQPWFYPNPSSFFQFFRFFMRTAIIQAAAATVSALLDIMKEIQNLSSTPLCNQVHLRFKRSFKGIVYFSLLLLFCLQRNKKLYTLRIKPFPLKNMIKSIYIFTVQVKDLCGRDQQKARTATLLL